MWKPGEKTRKGEQWFPWPYNQPTQGSWLMGQKQVQAGVSPAEVQDTISQV